jgi:hypothetical protein
MDTHEVPWIPAFLKRRSASSSSYTCVPSDLFFEEKIMSLGTILLIILILMLIGAIPTWPHSRNWGYGPSGGLGLVVIILIVLLLLGVL